MMRLSWNEIRARAARFSEEWKDERYERAETQSFYNDLFEVFGVKRRRVASFEEPVKGLGNKRGFIDLFWKGVLLVEHKSAGRSLIPAKTQALGYFPGLNDADLPRYILLSDFQNLELYDLDEGTEIKFKLIDLHSHVDSFAFILGAQKRTFRDQDPANIEASELMGRLHDSLEASGYIGHDLERLLVRILFCLFADDTGIFDQRDIFDDLIRSRTAVDGSDLGSWLHTLFEVLNTPTEKRQAKLDDDLKQFPYVNGELFAERLPTPAFDAGMRARLLEALDFSWDAISPAIFGSLFQSVMKPKERRALGAHYTTERNILKVIEPLFLESLRLEFDRLCARRDTGRSNALKAFQDRLSSLRFLDPACGCGNFLIIAYRELRSLETDVLKELNHRGQRTILDVATLSKVNVNQFYGIEIGEFPARIAEVALWMMDHIMNVRLSFEFGQSFARIPLTVSPHIQHGDSLEVDWNALLPAKDCSFIFGNPPFIGAKIQSDLQRGQVRRIAKLGGSGGTLDYVAAWFLKAGSYAFGNRAAIGFVATNSITQGEQVAQLWPLLFAKYELEIAFAHRTFAWGSDARGVAHVHVVVIGLVPKKEEPTAKRLFSYDNINGDPTESRHPALTAYLFSAETVANRHLVVSETNVGLTVRPAIVYGNMPNDDGNLILSEAEKVAALRSEPDIADLIRTLLGAKDFISGSSRYCLWLDKVPPDRLRRSTFVKDRAAKVKIYRLKSNRKATQRLADTPTLFAEIRHTGTPYILVPRHPSQSREYIPFGFYDGTPIVHDSCLFMPDASIFEFGLLSSRMHVSWLSHIGGRIKSDYRYSIGVVYNTFPWPELNESARDKVARLAQGVLDARKEHANATLADLYDPNVMPGNLRKAHRALDAGVDRLYRSSAFGSDRERVEHLFGLYEKLTASLVSLAEAPPPKRRKKNSALKNSN